MRKIKILFVVLTTFLQITISQENDSAIVQIILDINNVSHWKLDSVAVFTNGRITSLNLNNQNIALKGITKIPRNISLLTELTRLTINDNDIRKIPRQVFNLTKLITLELKNCNIISLPPGIYKLKTLKELDLRNNELKKIPIKIGNLLSLEKLQLWGMSLKPFPNQLVSYHL